MVVSCWLRQPSSCTSLHPAICLYYNLGCSIGIYLFLPQYVFTITSHYLPVFSVLVAIALSAVIGPASISTSLRFWALPEHLNFPNFVQIFSKVPFLSSFQGVKRVHLPLMSADHLSCQACRVFRLTCSSSPCSDFEIDRVCSGYNYYCYSGNCTVCRSCP